MSLVLKVKEVSKKAGMFVGFGLVAWLVGWVCSLGWLVWFVRLVGGLMCLFRLFAFLFVFVVSLFVVSLFLCLLAWLLGCFLVGGAWSGLVVSGNVCRVCMFGWFGCLLGLVICDLLERTAIYFLFSALFAVVFCCCVCCGCCC